MSFESASIWASLVAALAIAGVIVGHPRLEHRLAGALDRILGLAGGVAVGYVSLFLLPKIGDASAALQAARPELPELLQYGHYLIFLAGLLIYFLIDRVALNKRLLPAWLHGGAFAVYGFTTGHVVATVPRPAYFPYVLVALALGLHFVGICHQLRAWHRQAFDRHLRWLVAVALLSGWLVGALGMLPKAAMAALVAFLGGGILVNVLREEWPERVAGRTLLFLAGVLLFVVLVVIVRSFTGERV